LESPKAISEEKKISDSEILKICPNWWQRWPKWRENRKNLKNPKKTKNDLLRICCDIEYWKIGFLGVFGDFGGPQDLNFH
jgi:hypothetical protein